jgi:hypothetical protein
MSSILVAVVYSCGLLSSAATQTLVVTAFSVQSILTTRPTPTRTKRSLLQAGQEGNNDFGALTSQLARLDQQWNIQQRSSKTKSRWSKLVLPKDPNDMKEEGTATTNPFDAAAGSSQDFVWLLEPKNSIPSCIVVFTGGAGLGQFPHIAYSQLLTRISNRLNAAVLAVPYQVGLDHFELAKQAGDQLRRALVFCQDDPSRQYPDSLPTYNLAHSLGCKLQTIYVAATGQEFAGTGFMSFNNFGFSQTVGMARMFADQIGDFRSGGDAFSSRSKNMNPLLNEEVLNNLFQFAETIVGVIGVDFSPNAQDTERLIQLRYDDAKQRKTRLFVFDEDNLDSSKEFLENCRGSTVGPSASGLPGGHLAPVFFKLDWDALELEDVPVDARDMAKEAMGGFQSASFGDEGNLDKLVDEVCGWILGKGPTRSPKWDAPSRQEPPRLAGMSTTPSS